MFQHIVYLREQFVPRHVVPYIDGGGEPLVVRSAMALDDDFVETQQNAAVGFTRIHLLGSVANAATRTTDSQFDQMFRLIALR